MNEIINKLSIGTANFGLDYGVSNIHGKLDINNISKILSIAKNSKILSIDTAFSYGLSHEELSKFNLRKFNITTKININESYEKSVLSRKLIALKNSFETSGKLNLLIHNSDELEKNVIVKVLEDLNYFKTKGLVNKIGVSLYEPKSLDKIFKVVNFDCVQCPFNVFDRRIIETGWAKKLKDNEIELQTRSVFLQGLLFKNIENLPSYFLRWENVFLEWYHYLSKTKQKPEEAALSFVVKQKLIDKVIVGIDNTKQLNDIIGSNINIEYPEFNMPNIADHLNLILPFNWRLK